ncbi:MAG: hypothetical protein ACPGU1_04965 [Myxococcota bacterium]
MGTSAAFRVLDWDRASGQLVSLEELELPEGAELVVAPVLLKLALESPEEAPRRVQLLLRAVRRDGGVQQWFLGPDGRSSIGERGFQLGRGSSIRASFGGADYGPVRVAALERLELALAVMPTEPERGPLFLGVAALKSSGEQHPARVDALAQDGASCIIARRLAVTEVQGVAPGPQSWRLVVVGSVAGERVDLGQLHEFDGAQLIGASGEPVVGLSFVVLDLHLTVPDHR